MSRYAHSASVRFLPLVFFTLCFESAPAAEQPFYAGKTITAVIGTSLGGTGGLRYTAVMKYLPKYIPGNPAIVPQYMPAAGGVTAANHVAHMAKRDGLTISGISSSLYANTILGAAGVRYKLDDFTFLGSSYSGGPHVLTARPGLRLDTVEKLKAYKGLRFAQRSVGHAMYVIDRLFAYVLELDDPRWVLGYNQQEIDLSVERGEADALCTTLHSFVRDRLAWIQKGYTVPIVLRNPKGGGAEVARKFPLRPAHLEQYADTPSKKAVMQFHAAMRPSASVFFVPKGIPDAALKDLKQAFGKVWSDPQFVEEYERLIGEPSDPVTGEEIERVLAQLPKDPNVMQLYKQITGPEPLPPAR